MTRPLAQVVCGARAVTFDIDHTLVDTASAFRSALGAAIEPFVDGAAEIDRQLLVDRWHADPHAYYRAYTRGERGFDEQRFLRAEELVAGLGAAPLGDTGFAVFNARFDEAFEAGWAAFPDAARAVEELAAAGVPMGAVSNAGRSMQERKLAAVGLGDLMPVLVTVETLGVGKPDPRVFREAARMLDVPAADVVYVGDEPDIDAAAATEAGLRAVRLLRAGDTRFPEWPSDQYDYAEVADLTGIAAAVVLASGS